MDETDLADRNTTDIVVSKFGGSSVANATQIEKVRKIVAADARRRIVVVSAPGRLRPDEEKLTDHLINIATGGEHFRDQRIPVSVAESRKTVTERFASIIKDLEVVDDELLSSLEADLNTQLSGQRRIAFLASRGEHYNARIIARYFAKCGMQAAVRLPEDIGLQVTNRYLDTEVTEAAFSNTLSLTEGDMVSVVPGYYGVTESGEVAVFSRGGSDLTGGVIANAVDADCYENWTDVSGVFEVDPRVIENARTIPRLTFKEIRLLSSKGFNVFHLNAMKPCWERKIPIHIGNTNRPSDPGTVILSERVPEEGVVGIAQLNYVAYINIEKYQLGEEIGFTAKLLTIFQDFNIQSYHYPTDKDDISVVVDQNDLTGTINDLRRRIEAELKPDSMDVVYNLSILTPVGMGLRGNSYPIVEALSALSRQHIPIKMIDQSPSQMCFHIGVPSAVADAALKILYEQLIA